MAGRAARTPRRRRASRLAIALGCPRGPFRGLRRLRGAQLVLLAGPLALDAARVVRCLGRALGRRDFLGFEARDDLARHAPGLALLDQAEVRLARGRDEAHAGAGLARAA